MRVRKWATHHPIACWSAPWLSYAAALFSHPSITAQWLLRDDTFGRPSLSPMVSQNAPRNRYRAVRVQTQRHARHQGPARLRTTSKVTGHPRLRPRTTNGAQNLASRARGRWSFPIRNWEIEVPDRGVPGLLSNASKTVENGNLASRTIEMAQCGKLHNAVASHWEYWLELVPVGQGRFCATTGPLSQLVGKAS
jgi:hypothetical protein